MIPPFLLQKSRMPNGGKVCFPIRDEKDETVIQHGSSFETVTGIAVKVQELKQNRYGFCFRRCILTFFGRTVSQIGPNSFELMQTVSSISPKEKDGGL
jgi:hypothetical protein